MKKLLLLVGLTMLAPLARAQNYYSFPPTQRYPNSQFYVCGFPATGNPCSNRVSVFPTNALGTPYPQPITTNADGSFSFWFSASTTHIVVQVQGPLGSMFDVTTGGGAGAGQCITTVANLVNVCGTTKGNIAQVTDGSSASDCSIGGGTNAVSCIYSGSAYIFTGNPSSNPNFSAVQSGTNLNTLAVGNSLKATGAGVIQANQINEPPIFFTNDFAGSDLCAKITAALNTCPSGSNQMCEIYIQPTVPGSIDTCAAGTSDFEAGVPVTAVWYHVLAQIDLKKTVHLSLAPHKFDSGGSNQSISGGRFIMDSGSFTSTATFANGGTSTLAAEGPAGVFTPNVLFSDGDRTSGSVINQWQNNAFGSVWNNVALDMNGVANTIAYYTANRQEGSEYNNIRVWNNAANVATSTSYCMFFDHYAAQTGNFGPSHFHINNSGCDPYPNSTGTTSNNTIYGVVYEGKNCPPATCTVTGGSSVATGGNIGILGGTYRGGASNQLMQYGVWIDQTTNNMVQNIHCEWMNTNCAIGVGTTSSIFKGISDVNNPVNAVGLGAGTANNTVEQSDNGVTDTPNACTIAVTTNFYEQSTQSGWWSNSFHQNCLAGVQLSGINFASANNSVLGVTAAATAPSLLPVPSCSTASSALTWTTGTGFGCNSIVGGGGSPAGSTNDLQINGGGGTFAAVASHSAPTGSVATGNNAAPPTMNNPGLTDSANSPVNSGGAYTFACPTATTVADDGHVIRFQSGANTSPIIPLSSATGCAGIVFRIAIESGGPYTFSRTSTDTFSVYNGNTATLGATSFQMSIGQSALVNQGATGLWEVWIEAGAGTVTDGAGTTTIGKLAQSTSTSHVIAYADFPEHLIFDTAACNNAATVVKWSLPSSNAPTVACRAGTNNQSGVLQWANNNATTNAQFVFQLPFDWDTTTQPFWNIVYGSGANTSGTVKWTISSACTKSDGSVTDDPAFVAETTSTGKTMAVANREWSENAQFANITSGNNCVGGSMVILKVTSGSGTATSTVNVEQMTLTIPRLLAVQAN